MPRQKTANPGAARSMRRAAAPLVLILTCGACTDLLAEEKPSAPPAPAPAPAQQAPEAAKPADPAPAAPAAPTTGAPQGQRPIDEGAIKALAAEVARLRAELAALKGAPAAPGEPAEPAAPAKDLVSDVPRVSSDEPVAGSGPAPGEEPVRPSADDDRSAEERGGDGAEQVVERTVERIVEREVPVYVENTVVVERPVEVVYYEEVVYGGSSCRQYIPHGHVHSIGCGHHYYGCACHPWYYDLDDCGLSLHFTFVDDDCHDHGRPRRPGYYAQGYRNGFRDGVRADLDDDGPNGYSRGRRPSDPARPLDSATASRPSLGERGPSARTPDERPPVVSRDDAPTAGRPSGRAPSSPSGHTGNRVGGELADGSRTPRSGPREPAAPRADDSRGRPPVSRDPRVVPTVGESMDRDPRGPDVKPTPRDGSGRGGDEPDREPRFGRQGGSERGNDRGADRTPDRFPERAPDRTPDRGPSRDRRERAEEPVPPPPPPPPPRAERGSRDSRSGGGNHGGGKNGDGGRRK